MSRRKKKKLATSPNKGDFHNLHLPDSIVKILEIEEKNRYSEVPTNPDLEYDLRSTVWISKKVKENNTYAQNLYAALCNNTFQKLDVMQILKNKEWSCSWRHSGGIVADLNEKGDYLDWYCSGIRDTGDDNEGDNPIYDIREYVSEGTVTDEVKKDLKIIGWIVIKND